MIQNSTVNTTKIKREDDNNNLDDISTGNNDDGDVLQNQSNYDIKKFTEKENENINNFDKKFGKLYKTFDVGFVKRKIWDTITDIKTNKKKLTFDNLIEKISETLDTNLIDNISTSTCFVCLLHLANEKSKEYF